MGVPRRAIVLLLGAVALAATPASAARCPAFCPDGIAPADLGLAIGGDSPWRTCAGIAAAAGEGRDDWVSEVCRLFAASELMCCPPPLEVPCEVCPGGVFLDALSESALAVCREVIDEATRKFEEGSEECLDATWRHRATCCPPEAAPEDPCDVCPDGITAIDEDDECRAMLVEMALALESDSDVCRAMKSAREPFCCPDQESGARCEICPDGLDPWSSAAEIEAQCEEAKTKQAVYPEDSPHCNKQMYEKMCCPDKSLCNVCPMGVSPDAGADHCQMTVDSAYTAEADSEFCDEMKAMELVCCPSPAENPCSICPEGYKVNEDVIVPPEEYAEIQATCGVVTTSVEEGSFVCDYFREFEADCCAPATADASPSDIFDPVDDSGNAAEDTGNQTSFSSDLTFANSTGDATPATSPGVGNATASLVTSLGNETATIPDPGNATETPSDTKPSLPTISPDVGATETPGNETSSTGTSSSDATPPPVANTEPAEQPSSLPPKSSPSPNPVSPPSNASNSSDEDPVEPDSAAQTETRFFILRSGPILLAS
ncbi:hypothetical protein ACHAWF_001343 [Thalassiosira exigua]